MAEYTAQVLCGDTNGQDHFGARVSSIFVIGMGSMLGALLPVFLAQTKHAQNEKMKLAFFIVKYFGSGVIIGTAFIHLLTPATELLQSPCLSGPITDYNWAEGIALMTIFTMFFVELLAARMEFFAAGGHETDIELAKEPARDRITNNEKKQQGSDSNPPNRSNSHYDDANTEVDVPAPGIADTTPAENDFSYPPGGADHLGHVREHEKDNETALVAAQLTSIFILEFGVIFHSIFIGLTLAVSGAEFTILYIVLSFHQTFEGLGLGTRLALTPWPANKTWLPWILGAAFGITTPIAIAIGLGVRTTFMPGSPSTMIVNGVFDSISAGILIYTGLVELMAHEFMFNEEMRKASVGTTLLAFGCMCVGAGLMALLGKWV